MEEKPAKVIVFMPNYNNSPYLSQSIKSVISQKTNFKYQILIIDDKSTDNSTEIIKKFQKKYPKKIKFIKNKTNLKCLATSIKGYKLINSQYFCVLDPDDYWINKNKLQEAIDFLDKHPKFTIYTTNTYIKKNNKLTPYFNFPSKDFSFNDLSNAVFGHTSGTLFRNILFPKKIPKIAYDAIGTIDEKVYEGDSFRNVLHLIKGKGHYENKIESVYRITKDGIWTSLNQFEQNLLNTRFYLRMFCFCKKNEEFFLRMSWFFLKSNINMLAQEPTNILPLNLFQFKKLFFEYFTYKKLKLTLSDKLKLKIYLTRLQFTKNAITILNITSKIGDIHNHYEQ